MNQADWKRGLRRVLTAAAVFGLAGPLALPVTASAQTPSTPIQFTPVAAGRYTPAYPPPGVASAPVSPQERKLCIDVCYKQLFCAGQANNGQALNACTNQCVQTLASRDPFTAKPWRAPAACLSQACGQPYNQCVLRAMQEPTAGERMCGPICEKRLQCNGQAGNPQAGQACMRSCLMAADSPDPQYRRAEEAWSSCLRAACGVAVEACVATRLGGGQATCAKVCEGRLKCAGASDVGSFRQCQSQCLGELANPQQSRHLDAELRCRGCGPRLAECVAKRLGGNDYLCFRACQKQLQCGGAADNVQMLNQCAGSCLQVMNTGNPAMTRNFLAVDGCRRKRCGTAFNSCLSSALNQPAVASAPQVDPVQVKCEALCGKLGQCAPQAAGPGCLTRCMRDPSAAAEFDAVKRCDRRACGDRFDACMLQRLKVSRGQMRCATVCRKEIGCAGNSIVTYQQVANCARGCQQNRTMLEAQLACHNSACGQAYATCVSERLQPTVAVAPQPPPSTQPPIQPAEPPVTQPQPSTQPHTPPVAQPDPQPTPETPPIAQPDPTPPEPQQPQLTAAQRKCRDLCSKAIECQSADEDQESCMERCGSHAGSRREFKYRYDCRRHTCETYQQCVFGKLRVRGMALQCVQGCRHDFMCREEPASIQQLASCAKNCSYTPPQLEVITDCAGLCGTAFDTCMQFKMRALAEARQAEQPAEPEVTTAEQACRSLCEKAESCTTNSGGDKCVARCLGRSGRKEFRAREQCAEKTCDEYDFCVLRRMGVSRSKVVRCAGACKHELTCEGDPTDLNALMACTRKCEFDDRELSAIAECQEKGCGRDFSQCVLARSGQLQERQAVQQQCESLCAQQETCARGTGKSCTERCVAAGAEGMEVKARQACASRTDCAQHDECLLDEANVRADRRRCFATCQWEGGCARGNQTGNLEMLRGCMNRCRHTDEELEVRSYCESRGCGSGFRTCLRERTAELRAQAQAAAQPSPEELRCSELCKQAEECVPGTGGEACTKRCVEQAHTAEFEARESCKEQLCARYESCVLEKAGLAAADMRCAPRCRKQAACEAGGFKLAAVVSCAENCKDSDVQVRAASECEAQTCGQQYDACVADKEAEQPVLTEAQLLCKAMCDQVEACTPGLGGQKCMERCTDSTGQFTDEFEARKACQSESACRAYDRCVVARLLGGGEEPAPPEPQPPVEEPPSEEPPAEEPPAEEPPAEEPPAEEPPAEEPPAEEPPAEEPPAEEPPAEEPPPAEEAPAADPPAEEPPAEAAPAEDEELPEGDD